MPEGVRLEAQAPGGAHADLGFWLQSQIIGQSMAMTEQHLNSVVEHITANRFVLPRNRQTGARITNKGTAIVEVHGMLINRAPVLGSFWGLTAYEGLTEQFRRLETNDDVKRIVLDINTPGGLVMGIRACSDALEKLAAKKPVHAIAHDMCASAGYWLGAVAETLAVTPDGLVGSIGVRAARVSYAEMIERDGIQIHTFTAGAAKADGSVMSLLSPGEAAETQFEIDRDYDRFVAHVVKHRPMTEAQVRDTDARCCTGHDAVAAGLADSVETLEGLVERLEKSAAKVKPKTKQTTQAGSKAGLAPVPKLNAGNPDTLPDARLSKGAKRMTTNVAAEGASADLADQITQVLASLGARKVAEVSATEAKAADSEAQATKKDAVTAAVEAERARIFAILDCDDAKDRPKLAMALARAQELTAETAKALLAAAPAQAEAKTEAEAKKDPLDNALAKQMAKPGNSAGVKPEASESKARPSFVEFCTPAKK